MVASTRGCMDDPRIREYEGRHRCRLTGFLGPGPGQDGFVLRSNRFTAVKFFDRLDVPANTPPRYRPILRRDVSHAKCRRGDSIDRVCARNGREPCWKSFVWQSLCSQSALQIPAETACG